MKPAILADVPIRILQSAVVLDPYARAVIGRRQFGELGPVSRRYSLVQSSSLVPLHAF